MLGLFMGAVGQFALSIIPPPKGEWITNPKLPELGRYRDQSAIDLWKKAQKWGHFLTFLGFIFTIIGFIPFSGVIY
jgi:hypothetical protein